MKFVKGISILLVALPAVLADATSFERRENNGSAFASLIEGNKEFREDNAELIHKLSKGQSPEFLFLGCSDSRVNENSVFDQPIGTFFTERNIANQFDGGDNNVKSVLAYGVEHLHVKHIIVMGHYGCGGVQAAIASPPPLPWDSATVSVQQWVAPIRAIWASSDRKEIKDARDAYQGLETIPAPPNDDPAFRALVEENVKNSVANIATSSVIREHYKNTNASEHALFIHGWVYNIDDGKVQDLNVTVGPDDAKVVPAPLEKVEELAKRSYKLGHVARFAN